MSTTTINSEDVFLSMLQNQGKSEPKGFVKAITIRIPIHQYAAVEAYHRHTGMSKNRVIYEALSFALDVAYRGLDRTNKKAFTQLESEAIAELSKEGFGESVGDL
jgi:hypothetical protein